jgi:hypothetical protein
LKREDHVTGAGRCQVGLGLGRIETSKDETTAPAHVSDLLPTLAITLAVTATNAVAKTARKNFGNWGKEKFVMGDLSQSMKRH